LQASAEGTLVSKYVKVQVLSVLDTLMTTTYWLVATVTLVNVVPKAIAAVVLAVSVASLLRPVAEPPPNYGVRFLLRMYMRMGRKGAVRFGKLYWSSTALNALLAGAVGITLLISWGLTHVVIFLWASLLVFSSVASLPAQLPALLLDDAAYFRVVLLSNFVRYVLLYIMWRGSIGPQLCFESFLVGSLLALALGIGYAAWKGIGPRVWDGAEVKEAARIGTPAWLEGAGVTVARWGVLTAVVSAAYVGLVSPLSSYYVFTALLAGNIIASLISGWVNIVLLLRGGNQRLLPAKVVGLASGMAFPFATYFVLNALHLTADTGMALLAGAMLASLPVDLLGSLLSGRAHASIVPGSIKVLYAYALAQFLAPVITYGVYFGLVITFGKSFTAIALPYIAVRLLSLMLAKLMSRASLWTAPIVTAVIPPSLACVCLVFLFPGILSNVLLISAFSVLLALLSYVLTSISWRRLT